MKAALGLALWA